MNANILKLSVYLFIFSLFTLVQGQSEKIRSVPSYETFITTSFGLIQMGFGEYAYIKNPIATNESDYIRNSDEKNPGYYLMPPSGDEHPADTMERSFLEEILKVFLAPSYYDSSIISFANNIYLPNQGRNEFYFDIYSNDVRFLFSGWYGKFVHIMVFTNFDSKNSFVSQANHFFNLPNIDIDKIGYAEDIRAGERHDFFYSYSYADGTKLAGYPFLISISEDEISYKNVILDLTIYPKEHKDEK